MSTGEILGIVACGILVGAAVGAAVAALILARRERRHDREQRITDAYARWLAGRLTLSRASLSFVAAFRSLAAERPDSVYFQLRTDEVQRARADYCDAMRELDRAEADLIAWNNHSHMRDQLGRFRRVGAGELRTAINGTAAEVNRLRAVLREADVAAVAFVDAARKNGAWYPRRGLVRSLTADMARKVESIVDKWQAPV